MFRDVEFVDRYTGDPRGRPRFHNCCRPCEGMGCYPQGTPGVAALDREFAECPSCAGSGRVPLWRGIWRTPRWLWNGCRFAWRAGRDRDIRLPGMGALDHWRLVLWAGFLAEFGVAVPRAKGA